MIKRILLVSGLFLYALTASAQDGAYSTFAPYSIFGVGDIMQQGTAYNSGMGGVGIAGRSRRYQNTLNPAACTARDSLSFMADFSLREDNRIYRQGDTRSANNNFNINSIAFSFPVYRSSAMMVGISPYSSTGYSYYSYITDPAIVGKTGNVGYSSSGQGSIYQLYLTGGVTFWKRLSLGVEAIHYFGNIEKNNSLAFSSASYKGLSSGYDIYINANTAKFGIQYEEKIADMDVCFGATYKMAAKMKGYIEDYQISSGTSVSDTLKYVIDTLQNSNNASFASEIGVGISFRKGDSWRAEIDYTRSDWTKSGMGGKSGFSANGSSIFTPCVKESLMAGFEIVPNINDIRYYLKRCAYRGGAYMNKEYYLIDGNSVISAGITLGVTFPVSKMYNNGITVAMDLGQRGNISSGGIRERYVGFSLGFNTYDIWFQKYKFH